MADTHVANRGGRPSLFAPQSDPNIDPGSSSGGGEGMDRVVKKKTFTPKRIAMIVGVLLFIGLVGYGLSTTTGGRKLNVERDKITIAAVTQGPFQETISVTGNVLPRTTIYLDAVEGGRIEEIFVQEGALVEKNQPLLRLSNSNLQLSLLNSETQRIEQINRLEQTRFQVEQNNLSMRQQLTDMEYNIQRLKRDFDRNQELYDKQLISAETYERTRDEYQYWTRRRDLTTRAYRQDSLRQTLQIAQMEQSVDRMDQNFLVIQQKLENLTLRSPVTGQLTQFNAELGELQNPGFRFGQVDVLDGYKVEAGIDEFYINRVTRDQTATTLPIAGETYAMRVIRIYPEVLNGRFRVDLDFTGEAPPDIRRGQTIRLKLEMSAPDEAILIPRSGFYQTTGGNWIFVVDPSGDYATRRDIQIGRQSTDHYEVLRGLTPGEEVVTSSYDTYEDIDRLVFR